MVSRCPDSSAVCNSVSCAAVKVPVVRMAPMLCWMATSLARPALASPSSAISSVASVFIGRLVNDCSRMAV